VEASKGEAQWVKMTRNKRVLRILREKAFLRIKKAVLFNKEALRRGGFTKRVPKPEGKVNCEVNLAGLNSLKA